MSQVGSTSSRSDPRSSAAPQIDGEQDTVFYPFVDGAAYADSGKPYALVNPATGRPWGHVISSVTAMADAVASSRRAFVESGWPDWNQTRRGDVLRRLADLAERHSSDFARYETLATGKTVTATADEGTDLAVWLRFYAGAAEAAAAEAIELEPTTIATVIGEPVGVVGAITPFNGALSLGSWKICPALAVGNAVVVKPPLEASASSLLLAELAVEAGLPPGILNVVPGDADIGRQLACHQDVPVVSFTGSTAAARELAAQVGQDLRRFLCEAGGKSAHIVFSDAELDLAAQAVIRGGFGNAGQTCVAGSRVLVSVDIYEDFVADLVKRAEALRVGDPHDLECDLGPLAGERHLRRVTEIVERASAEGAVCLTGGRRAILAPPLQDGFFFEPTILKLPSLSQQAWREEIFGPVFSVCAFESDADAVRIANDSKYGLAAGIWTRSPSRARSVTRTLEAGTVWVNTYRYFDHRIPFGGYKLSGIGRENGTQVLRQFTNTKAIITVW